MPLDAAVIQGVFSDFKLVKTRSVAQLVVEIPIEEAQEALRLFGVPLPGKEAPVAIARLVASPAPPESVPLPVKNGDASDRAKAAYRDKDVMAKAVVRASVLCAEEAFQNWIWTHDGTASLPPGGDPAKRERTTASLLRGALGISSRSLIGTAPDVYEAFLALETDYKIAVGRAAAPR